MKISEIKIGEYYKCKSLNQEVKITNKSGLYVYFTLNNHNYNKYYTDFTKLDNNKLSIAKKISEKKKEIEALQAKLDFMKESGETTYNENTFKAYQTLKLIDNKKLSNMERAKLISKLIN